MTAVRCEGWWEQPGLGRQAMHDLRLTFDGNVVSGGGRDIVGSFTLQGVTEGAMVSFAKQYAGAHSVAYVGTFDGEGVYRGRWSIFPFDGDWLIQVKAADGDATEIHSL